MPYSEAQYRAQKKYDAKMYDCGTVKMPKGTRARIQALGQSVNGYTVRALLDRLEIDEQKRTEAAGGIQNAKTQNRTGETQNAAEVLTETQNAKTQKPETQSTGPEEALQEVPVLIPAGLIEDLMQYGSPAKLIEEGARAIIEEYRAGLRS